MTTFNCCITLLESVFFLQKKLGLQPDVDSLLVSWFAYVQQCSHLTWDFDNWIKEREVYLLAHTCEHDDAKCKTHNQQSLKSLVMTNFYFYAHSVYQGICPSREVKKMHTAKDIWVVEIHCCWHSSPIGQIPVTRHMKPWTLCDHQFLLRPFRVLFASESMDSSMHMVWNMISYG
jgi:hypothetical protein